MKRMMMITGLLAIVLGGCKKDKKDSNSCDAQQYGTLSVTYGSSTLKHSILTTSTPGSLREKISAKGKMTDTLHLAPGSYTFSISSLNDDDLAVDQVTQTATITVCADSRITTTF